MDKSFVFKQNNLIKDHLHIQAIVFINKYVNSELNSQLKPGGVWKSASGLISRQKFELSSLGCVLDDPLLAGTHTGTVAVFQFSCLPSSWPLATAYV